MLQSVIRHDRAIIAAGLFLISSLAWAYTARGARSMGELCIPMGYMWRTADVSAMLLMWFVMMVAMMTPSVAPMVILFASMSDKRRQQMRPFVPAVIFLSGYLSVWAAFSVAATMAQWSLHSLGLLSPMMVSTSPYLGASIFLAAATFQWTPMKENCLTHCRSPLGFLVAHWHPGKVGAFRMGLHHGLYCTGCCWALMGLLFVAGVMNLLWVAILSILVLAEKILPCGQIVARSASAVLLVLAMATLKRAF
jgi:predicted metal-binding membrane protein